MTCFGIYKMLCLFLNCVHLVSFISPCAMYFTIFWQRPFFRWRLLFALLLRLFASFCRSAAMQCLQGVQIIMFANISLMIKKHHFFQCDQNIVSSVTYRTSLHPCWVFEILLIAIFIILCCFPGKQCFLALS